MFAFEMNVAYTMPGEYKCSVPTYLQIAEDLRTAIEQGDYPPGGELPSERFLAKKHSVSRDVIRNALRVLTNEGLVVSSKFARKVRPTPTYQAMTVPHYAVVIARMPSPDERERLNLAHEAGIPVLVVRVAGEPDSLYAGNRIAIQFGE